MIWICQNIGYNSYRYIFTKYFLPFQNTYMCLLLVFYLFCNSNQLFQLFACHSILKSFKKEHKQYVLLLTLSLILGMTLAEIICYSDVIRGFILDEFGKPTISWMFITLLRNLFLQDRASRNPILNLRQNCY